jgi:hypothetical protein
MFSGKVSFLAKENSSLQKANSIDFLLILKNVGVNLPFDRKIICPFKSHKFGMEKTPSLHFYLDTNSFYCFGCQTGGGPVEFVSVLKNISKNEAIEEILSTHQEGYLLDLEDNKFNNELKQSVLDLSLKLRTKLSLYKDNEFKLKEIENISKIYDSLIVKYNLTFDGYLALIKKIDDKLNLI